MAYQSAYKLAAQLESAITRILSAYDISEWSMSEQMAARELKAALVDARLDIRDYEFAETRAEQIEQSRAAKERLDHVRALILQMSAYNVFSAIDVAHLGADIEHISELLR